MRTSGAPRNTRSCAALIAVAAFGLTSCGDATTRDATSEEARPESSHSGGPAEPANTPGNDDIRLPPPVRVSYGDESVDLKAWTSCYGSMCMDGIPPRDPPDVGNPPRVVVEFPLENWTFKALFDTAGPQCARPFPAKLDEIEPGRFVLDPAGYAGEYDVTLSGRGPDGDVAVTFRWTTPSDGPLPTPSSYVGIIADRDGQPSSYGVEMSVSHLAAEPDHVDATITVTASDGDSLTFSPRLHRGCRTDGSLWWDGPTAKGKQAADLGPPPFTYDVELDLDGRTHRARAVWPEDVIRRLAPYVRLDFVPSLPALA